jgi:hypothetical protein
MIEKWKDKKVNDKVVVRQNSAANFDVKSRNGRGFDHLLHKYLSLSSSELSSGGGFSSSESSETVYMLKSRSSCYGMQWPKPIRTCFFGQNPQLEKPKHKNSFVKTKSKALENL